MLLSENASVRKKQWTENFGGNERETRNKKNNTDYQKPKVKVKLPNEILKNVKNKQQRGRVSGWGRGRSGGEGGGAAQ